MWTAWTTGSRLATPASHRQAAVSYGCSMRSAFLVVSLLIGRFPGCSHWAPQITQRPNGKGQWKRARLPNCPSVECRSQAGFWQQKQGSQELKASPSYAGTPCLKIKTSKMRKECGLRRQTSYLVNFVFIYFRCIYLLNVLFFPISQATVLVHLHPLRWCTVDCLTL